ncbi:MAG: hypothetical protein ACR2HR_17230 [Euzebya sp.]
MIRSLQHAFPQVRGQYASSIDGLVRETANVLLGVIEDAVVAFTAGNLVDDLAIVAVQTV